MVTSQTLPVWRNIVARTLLYYALVVPLAWWLDRVVPQSWGAIDAETLGALVRGEPAGPRGEVTGPAALPAAVAMCTAFLTALPVAWVYTMTRRKKGFQQSVVQTYLILPVVVASIVVLVKHSLPLAFSLAGIVAAVRFRTSLDDSKDAAGIFVATAIGMAAAVEPAVAWVISGGFNLLTWGLWVTDFGRPALLEGRTAERRLERALQTASRTGTFIARLDDEVLKSMAPEQLEALADRAWRRRKRNEKETADDESAEHEAPKEKKERPRFEQLLRLRTADGDVARARALTEPRFDGLFREWKYLGTVREGELRVLEYGVKLAKTVTPGVVSDDLRGIPDSPVRGVELK
jgi:hypothetical protein